MEKNEGRYQPMNKQFAETLRKLREDRGLSQAQLGIKMFVNQSTVARWEAGKRLPDIDMLTRLSKVLEADMGMLLSAAVWSDDSPNVILVDNSKPILNYEVAVLEEVMPNATITGFIRPREAIEYAQKNQIDLAILDIELGTASGLDLCSTLLGINPCTNVLYLTSYPDYALDAWDTDACGFMVKPLTPESVRKQLGKLRYPFSAGGTQE